MFGDLRVGVKNLLVQANKWLRTQTIELLRLGTTPTSGITLQNITPAAVNAQQVSPAMIWEGRVWNTNSSTNSPIAVRQYALPVQGGPGWASWKLQTSINNAAYVDALTFASNSSVGKPTFTISAFTTVSTDNSSTIDTLQSLNVASSGSQNHIVMSNSGTIRAGWSTDSSGNTSYKAAGASPNHNFFVGSSITSNTQIIQVYGGGLYNSYSNYNAGVGTFGSGDTSAQTTLSAYGSFATKGLLVNTAAVTLAATETMVYCDPSNASFCTGTPAAACGSYSTQTPCNAHSGAGCSWFVGNSCSPGTGTDSSTCTGQGAGCVWDEVPCSGANNTDQTTCESQDDTYGGGCSWDTSTCPSQMDEGACNGISGCAWSTTCSASPDESTCNSNGCTWNFSDCTAFNGQSQGTCETGHTGCTWTGADCHAFDSTDQSTCETGHTGCIWDGGGSLCNGVYDEASTCAGQYDTSCTGDTCSGNLCGGNYSNGNCSGTYGAGCQGTAACSNLTDGGSVACAAETGCTWTVGITVTLPLSSNSLRGTTGRVYSVVHVGSTGTCAIQGQTGENVFQYGNLTLFKKGDKVLLHNQNISFPCSGLTTSGSGPCGAQAGCTWIPVTVCASFGDESSCNSAYGCSWDGENNTCLGGGNPTAFCNGNYNTTDRWYAHSLERGLNYTAKTANYTIVDIDDVVDCTANSFTLTLPSAALNNGKQYNLKNTGAGTITLNTTGGQTIDGGASGTVTLTAGQAKILMSNNSNWIIVSVT